MICHEQHVYGIQATRLLQEGLLPLKWMVFPKSMKCRKSGGEVSLLSNLQNHPPTHPTRPPARPPAHPPRRERKRRWPKTCQGRRVAGTLVAVARVAVANAHQHLSSFLGKRTHILGASGKQRDPPPKKKRKGEIILGKYRGVVFLRPGTRLVCV